MCGRPPGHAGARSISSNGRTTHRRDRESTPFVRGAEVESDDLIHTYPVHRVTRRGPPARFRRATHVHGELEAHGVCAVRREGWLHRGSRDTHTARYGPTHRTRAKDHATTPVPSCQPSGIRYALRVSRLPPLPVDTRTKLRRPNSCVFMRATIWAEQQNGLWFQACVTKRFRGSRRIPQGWSSQPLGSRR